MTSSPESNSYIRAFLTFALGLCCVVGIILVLCLFYASCGHDVVYEEAAPVHASGSRPPLTIYFNIKSGRVGIGIPVGPSRSGVYLGTDGQMHFEMPLGN